MPVRSTLLQRVLFHVQRELASGMIVRESELLEDLLSGDRREVDIVIRTKVADHDVIVSVECREQRRKATVDWVEQMAMKHRSLPTSKLVLVSATGFSASAAATAARHGIEVYSIDQAINADWNKLLGEDLRRSIYLFGYRIIACGLVLACDDSLEHRAVPQVALFDREGHQKGSLGETIYRLTNQPSFTNDFLERLRTLEVDHTVVGARLRIRPPLFVSDESDSHDEVAEIRVYLEIKKVPSGVELTAARYREMPVAYGHGTSAAGDFTLTLMQSPSGTPLGAFSLSNPATGDVDTTSLRFTGEHSSFKFITDRPLGSRDN
jgi:hypothetical protein